MNDTIDSAIRRFKLLNIMFNRNLLDPSEPIYPEFKKLGEKEITNLPIFMKSFLDIENCSTDIIKRDLLELGYTENFVRYLLDLSSDDKIADQTLDEEPNICQNNTDDIVDEVVTISDYSCSESDGDSLCLSDIEILEKSDFSNESETDDENCDSEDDSEDDSGDDDAEDDPEEFDLNNQINDVFNWRQNQIRAINETIKQDFKSGVHNQIMGAGKANIMINLIGEHFKIYPEAKCYLLLCDRQEILRKMFFNDKGEICREKILKWKAMGIVDLTKFDIIEYIYSKHKDLVDQINSKNRIKPVLIICNNAFLRVSNYQQIRRNKIALTILDECHSVSAQCFYTILKHLKYKLRIPIIGFSATPLRPKAETKLCDIFSKNMDPSNKNPKLNIISQYGLINAIQDGIVLPLNYHFIEVKSTKRNAISSTNFDITKNIINKILPDLPYKKILCWCRTITMLQKWYNFFKREFPILSPYMSSHKDGEMTRAGYNCDFNSFYQSNSNAVLLCVNRCREGSDIPNLDCGIYLDAVKKRSILVSMQTSGRVIRPDNDNMKSCGIMVDMFISKDDKSVEHLTVDKIFDYYNQIIYLAENIDELQQTEAEKFKTYFKYKKLLAGTLYDEEKSEITIKIDTDKKIKINIELIDKNLDWSCLKELLNLRIKDKCDVDNYLELKMNFRFIAQRINVRKLNPVDWSKWYEKFASKYKSLIPASQIKKGLYKNFWENKTWFDVLHINKLFYQKIDDLEKALPKKLDTFEDYKRAAKSDPKIPLDVLEYYDCRPADLIKNIKNIREEKTKLVTKANKVQLK